MGFNMTNRTGYSVTIERAAGDPISRRIFGGNIEAMGRVIYDGVWDRERNIPRADVKAAIGALGTTVLRWPGSSSASGYRWREGIGPYETRPQHDTTWWTQFSGMLADMSGIKGDAKAEIIAKIGNTDPNQFGTHEFLQYCVDLDIEPILSANIGGGNPFGLGTPEEAAAWVRYCNVDHIAPRSVEWWQLGNEVWGEYEHGHCPPSDYAARILELTRAMRAVDPNVKVIAAATGFNAADFNEEMAAALPDIDRWNKEVFSAAGDEIDAVSISWYFPGIIGRHMRDDNRDAVQMVSGGDALGAMLDMVISDLDAIGGAAAKLPVFLTEWGRQVKFPDNYYADNHKLFDGMFYAGAFNRIIERSSRVPLANVSMMANVVSPIQTEGDRHFVTAAHLVTSLYRKACRGRYVPAEVQSRSQTVPGLDQLEDAFFAIEMAKNDREAPILDAVATMDHDGTSLFVSNRSMTDAIDISLAGIMPEDCTARLRYVTADSPFDANSIDRPNAIRFSETAVEVRGGRAEITLAPCTAGVVIAGPVRQL